ncbi:FGGY-family carbohydrate kinase [Aeromicrobium sp. CTD01-1L150]|uniref:xylulokinase n=1 Tax=Aeromicrobium sp. CTD01-1L150 TaxID=3341830 RepID=UPI0035C1EF83
MQTNDLVLAVDCGTTSLKALLIDQHRRVLAEANESYPLTQTDAGGAEQAPEDLWAAVARASRAVVAAGAVDPSEVTALVPVASWKGIIPLSRREGALCPAMLWLDARAQSQAARLNEEAGELVGTGQEYWPRLMWLKENEPDVWRRADHVVGLNTYLKWRATGVVCTEPSDDFVHSPDEATSARYAAILSAAGLDADLEKFAPARPSTAEVGFLTKESAADLGLTTATRVFNGFGDLPAITVGTGRAESGDTHLYFGTSSWFVEIVESREGSPAPLHFTLGPGREGATYALQSGCLAYDWSIETLYPAEKRELGAQVHDLVSEQVAQIPAGSGNLLATHWLNGELPPLSKSAKGLFLNLTPQHDRRHMVRAMMESICFAHRSSVEQFVSRTGDELPVVLAAGGGALNAVWMQILADVLQRTVEVPEHPGTLGAWGAYCSALVGLGHVENTSEIPEQRIIGRRFDPNPGNAATYDRLYAAHQQLHPALAGVFDQLNGAS